MGTCWNKVAQIFPLDKKIDQNVSPLGDTRLLTLFFGGGVTPDYTTV